MWKDVEEIKKEQRRSESNLKGRMAESLVYDLLREAGNEVYKIGYETILPGLTKIEGSFKRKTEVGEKIRAIPDFFVIDKIGDPHLVEVKFRWHPDGHKDDYKIIERIKSNWGESIIVFINCHDKPYFRLCPYPFLDKKRKLKMEPLQKFKSFNISEEIIDKFDELVKKYLTPTLK